MNSVCPGLPQKHRHCPQRPLNNPSPWGLEFLSTLSEEQRTHRAFYKVMKSKDLSLATRRLVSWPLSFIAAKETHKSSFQRLPGTRELAD